MVLTAAGRFVEWRRRRSRARFGRTEIGISLGARCGATSSFATSTSASDRYPALSSGVWGMDLIFCRNVLIYFDRDTIAHVAKSLLASLGDDGWLVLGATDPSLHDFVKCEVVQTDEGLAYRHFKGLSHRSMRSASIPAFTYTPAVPASAIVVDLPVIPPVEPSRRPRPRRLHQMRRRRTRTATTNKRSTLSRHSPPTARPHRTISCSMSGHSPTSVGWTRRAEFARRRSISSATLRSFTICTRCFWRSLESWPRVCSPRDGRSTWIGR